jgi:hypothetical protein
VNLTLSVDSSFAQHASRRRRGEDDMTIMLKEEWDLMMTLMQKQVERWKRRLEK